MKDSKKDTYEKDIIEVIKENNLFVIKDIFSFYTGCSRATFYNNKLDKVDTIKKAIDDNKNKTCQTLKNRWFNSDNPTLQIALFKTICSDDDHKRLSQSNIDIKSDGEQIGIEVNFVKREKKAD